MNSDTLTDAMEYPLAAAAMVERRVEMDRKCQDWVKTDLPWLEANGFFYDTCCGRPILQSPVYRKKGHPPLSVAVALTGRSSRRRGALTLSRSEYRGVEPFCATALFDIGKISCREAVLEMLECFLGNRAAKYETVKYHPYNTAPPSFT